MTTILGDEAVSNPEKVGIVTGASSGIGRAVALALAEDGYAVGLISRSEDKLEEVAATIRADFSPETAPLVLAVDVRDGEAVSAAVSKAGTDWGRLDLLFNSAGIHFPGNLDVEPNDFKEQFDVNMHGIYNSVRAAVPVMKEQGSGYIFNVASRRGRITTPAEGAYSATKHAVVGFSEALYKELCPEGIKVAAYCRINNCFISK